MGPGRQGTRGRAGVRLSEDVRAVSWAAALGVSGPRASRSENKQAERGARERAAGCGVRRASGLGRKESLGCLRLGRPGFDWAGILG